jgi:hypothetical protein
MENISLNCYDIPELVILSGFPWKRVAANKEATEPMVPLGKVEAITSNILWSPPWLGWTLWNICITNDHVYVPHVVSTSWSFPHSRLITGFVTRLTGRVSLVEQKLITLPEHPSSPPVFNGVRVTRSFILCVLFLRNSMNKNSMLHGEVCVRSSSIEHNTSINIGW